MTALCVICAKHHKQFSHAISLQNLMVAYFCHHLSDNDVDLSDLYVDLSVIYVDLSNHYVYLCEKYHQI